MGYSFYAYSKARFLETDGPGKHHPNEVLHILLEYEEDRFLLDGQLEGVYQVTGEEKDFNMCFGNYNTWRTIMFKILDKISLANSQTAWDDAGEDGIFHAMIHLCTYGVIIGPVTSKKLAGDFKNYRSTIEELVNNDQEVREVIEGEIAEEREEYPQQPEMAMDQAVEEKRQYFMEYYDYFCELFTLSSNDGFMRMS
ncbi:MAG: hypothetical protein WC473_02230 [Patescibacteria group bacterium]|jgi:hypothetical protein